MALIESFGDTLTLWLRSKVIPYILFGTCIVVIITSCVLNIFMIFMLKRRKLIALPTNRFLLQLIVIDFLACGFVLVPICVTALANSWILSNPLCYFHAVISTWLLLVSFGLVSLCFIERVTKQKTPKIHQKLFDTNVGVTLISGFVWAIDLGIALLPVFDIASIAYDEYQASCVVSYSKSKILAPLMFVLTFVLPFLVFIVCCIILFSHHRNKAKQKQDDMIEMLKPVQEQNTVLASPPASERSTLSTTGIVPAVEETPRNVSARRDTLAEMTMSEQETENNRRRYWKKIRKSTKHRPSRLQSVVSAVQNYDLLSDDHRDEDHHLAVTYMIVYSFITICWLPFLSLALANAFSDSIWQGWYSLTLIFSVLSFIAKPIIYLAHNRHFRQNSKMALPSNVATKVERIRNSISSAVNRLDRAVFVSPRADKTIVTTIAVNKTAKAWMKTVKKPDATPIIQEEGEGENTCGSSSRAEELEPDQNDITNDDNVHPNCASMITGSNGNLEYVPSLPGPSTTFRKSASPIPALQLMQPDD